MSISNDRISLPPAAGLGEELPIFCEKCGYSLHGLTQVRCEHCELLQFHCPECGHHQPINTLRPAVQRVLGRVRATYLALIVFLKLNVIGWMLFGWVVMGSAWSFHYDYVNGARAGRSIVWSPRPADYGAAIAFTLYALLFSMVSRMLLLRWKRSGAVGLVLAALVSGAITLGAYVELIDLRYQAPQISPPWTGDFFSLMALAAAAVIIGSLVVWPIWAAMARALLPQNAAIALLDWQQSQSDRSASSLTRA